jgi:hypothetical protein
VHTLLLLPAQGAFTRAETVIRADNATTSAVWLCKPVQDKLLARNAHRMRWKSQSAANASTLQDKLLAQGIHYTCWDSHFSRRCHHSALQQCKKS